MTLRELINFLEKRDATKVVRHGFNKPHSYRGYYDELAFEPARDVTIGKMLACAKAALGTTYEGYKGGEYVMEEYTDVWLAEWGCTGEMLGETLLKYMVGEMDLA